MTTAFIFVSMLVVTSLEKERNSQKYGESDKHFHLVTAASYCQLPAPIPVIQMLQMTETLNIAADTVCDTKCHDAGLSLVTWCTPLASDWLLVTPPPLLGAICVIF